MSAEPKEILKVLVDIIRREMDLKADQVHIYNQRWIIPADDRLYVTIKISGTKPYAVNRRYRPSQIVAGPTEITETLNEELSINAQDVLTINVYSHKMEARLRRNELILALCSTLSEQLQERHGFSIGVVPVAVTDVSEGEGTDMLNRYAITYNILYAQGSTKPVEYFDEFSIAETVLQP